MRHCLLISIIIFSLLNSFLTYKEFALARSRMQKGLLECSNGHNKQMDQVCFQKDVNYHLQLFIDGVVYYVGVDLTLPISWLKSPLCKNTTSQCHILQDRHKTVVQQEFRDVKVRFRLFGRQREVSHSKDTQIGGSELIAGQLENIEFAQFYAKDSRSARDLTRLLGMSLFLTPERDQITINNVSLLMADRLSKQVNEKVDGAISLRPKQKGNTLLSQLLASTGSRQQIISIFIHPQSKTGTLSIGDISLKNAARSHKDIIWTSMYDSPEGVSFLTSELSLKQLSQPNVPETRLSSNQEVLLTTSSSFLFLPNEWLEWIGVTLKKRTGGHCYHNKGRYRCEWTSIQGKKQAIMQVMSIRLPSGSIRIPFTTLILISDGLFFQLALRSSPSNKVILGQPFFQEYVCFINYGQGKVGFVKAIFHQSDKFTTILVYFLRLLFFSAIFLFLIYICYTPFMKLKRAALKTRNWTWKKKHQSFDELGSTELQT